MPQPKPSRSTLLEEVGSVDTTPQRLEEIWRAEPSFGPVIASNPSASIQLLDQLALHYPVEVCANPLIALRAMEVGGAYRGFSLRSLVCLCLACESIRDRGLLNELKRRMAEAFDGLRKQEFVTLSCVWLYRRTFILQPWDCDDLIDCQLEISLEYRAFIDGDTGDIFSAIPHLACEEQDLMYNQRARLVAFLESVDNGSLNSYIDSNIDADGDREHKGGCETLVTIHGASGLYSADGSLLCKDGKPILQLHALTNEFDSIIYKDGVVWVAVGEHEEVEREYHLALGELEQLHALANQSSHIPDDWHSLLALLLAS